MDIVESWLMKIINLKHDQCGTYSSPHEIFFVHVEHSMLQILEHFEDVLPT
jgi:hypothetical protein